VASDEPDEDDFEACFDAWPDTPVERTPPGFSTVVVPLFRGSVREVWRRPGRMERAIRGPNLVRVRTEGSILANAICVVDRERPLVELHSMFHRAGADRERVGLHDVPIWNRRQYERMRDWLIARPDWRTMWVVQIPFDVEWALTIAAKPTIGSILDRAAEE
jgi:hypothetical protein